MNFQFFKYVRLNDIQRWKEAGWEETDALKGTNHGDYSELMYWPAEGEPIYPATKEGS